MVASLSRTQPRQAPQLTATERVLLHGFLAGVGPGACPKAHTHRNRPCSMSGCEMWHGECTARLMRRIWRRTA